MEKILISACLCGDIVRYDGKSAPCNHPLIKEWDTHGRLVRFCPEVAGGLPTPRDPAEISGPGGAGVLAGDARVVTNQGQDVSAAFIKGAQLALSEIRRHGIAVAILKEKSPSCGSSLIYDGAFSGNLIQGMGVATSVLRRHGVKVFSEYGIERAKLFINQN